jgi:hypothetical protein
VGVEEELPSSGSMSMSSATSFNFSVEEAIEMTDPVEELRLLPYDLSLWALVMVQLVRWASPASLRM